MLKLSDLLQIETRYRPRPRFFCIIAALILTILCILAWDKLPKPKCIFTSPYMQHVFCEGGEMKWQ
jgi:hypothetical protein